MYRINQLPRKVLIVPDEVIAWGPTENSVDPRNLMLAIQIAEDRFIKSAICKDLYNDFRDKKNVVVTDINKDYLETFFPDGTTLDEGSFVNAIEFCSEWYQALWHEHLVKLIAECVVYIASPTNWSRYTSQGEMNNNPKSIAGEGQGSASVDLRDMKFKLDKMLMDRIDPLIASIQEYLYDNAGYFPFYNCRDLSSLCGDRAGNRYGHNGISTARKTAWVHVYDRRRNNNCDNNRGY